MSAIATLSRLDLGAAVTFFVGENGSGKSTLLEGIAAAAHLPTVGSAEVDADDTLAPQRALAGQLRLSWKHRTHRGFFLRAEDFFGFAKSLARMREDMRRRVEDVEIEYEGRSSLARALASGPAQASLADMQRLYGDNLDAASHGESFLRLFQSRLVPDGLYLLDEPETPLSPQSQLAFLTLMADAIMEGSQFVVATHSPILLAFPGATIYTFDRTPVERVDYGDLHHVNLTRDFLNDPERYLRLLITPGRDE